MNFTYQITLSILAPLLDLLLELNKIYQRKRLENAKRESSMGKKSEYEPNNCKM
jgi:hypothetical protein